MYMYNSLQNIQSEWLVEEHFSHNRKMDQVNED